MRKLILIALAVLVVMGAGVLSVRHYNKYQTKTARENALRAEAEAKKASEAKAQAQAREARIFDEYTRVRQECEKGLGIVPYVPAYLKKTVQTPLNCGKAVIQ